MLRRVLIWGVGGVVGLLLLAAGTVFALSEIKVRERFAAPNESVQLSTDSARIERGRHLATTLNGCAGCHGADLGGASFIDAGPFGRWDAPNLTTGEGGVLAQYSDAQLEAIIRHGVRPNGRSVHFMPADIYAGLSDEDFGSLIGYLRQAPPVNRTHRPPKVGPIARVLIATGAPLRTAPEVPSNVVHPSVSPPYGPTAEMGAYLVQISGCKHCHGPTLSGGPIPGRPPEALPAANITPAGIGHYSDEDFVRALRTGVRPDGRPISPEMPWEFTKRMTDEEIAALRAYLKTVAPKEFGGR